MPLIAWTSGEVFQSMHSILIMDSTCKLKLWSFDWILKAKVWRESSTFQFVCPKFCFGGGVSGNHSVMTALHSRTSTLWSPCFSKIAIHLAPIQQITKILRNVGLWATLQQSRFACPLCNAKWLVTYSVYCIWDSGWQWHHRAHKQKQFSKTSRPELKYIPHSLHQISIRKRPDIFFFFFLWITAHSRDSLGLIQRWSWWASNQIGCRLLKLLSRLLAAVSISPLWGTQSITVLFVAVNWLFRAVVTGCLRLRGNMKDDTALERIISQTSATSW